jgi:hypothetical protein
MPRRRELTQPGYLPGQGPPFAQRSILWRTKPRLLP